jgi:hypothetical protein
MQLADTESPIKPRQNSVSVAGCIGLLHSCPLGHAGGPPFPRRAAQAEPLDRDSERLAVKIAPDDPGRWETVRSAMASWPMTLRLVVILTVPTAVVALIVHLR